jgi:penicillin-binding protein 1A
MPSAVESGTARNAARRLKRPAAGKTGTTDEDRDAWFVGFTPELLAGV